MSDDLIIDFESNFGDSSLNDNIAPLDVVDSVSSNDSNIISDDDVVLKKISPAKWEALIDILEFLTKDSDESVVISNSIIMHQLKSGSILKADLKEVFDNQNIDLHISSPKKWVRLFKMFKNENVYIIEESNRFIVTNGQTKLFLPRQLNTVVSQLEFPDFEQTRNIANQIIQKESRDKIINLSKGLSYIEFLIKDNNIKIVNIPNTALFIIPEFMKDPEIRSLSVDNSDLLLRSSTFLPYPAETYQIIIGLNNLNDKYFMVSSCKTQLISIEIYEVLNDATGINDLF